MRGLGVVGSGRNQFGMKKPLVAERLGVRSAPVAI
jgi:hypothetical protein